MLDYYFTLRSVLRTKPHLRHCVTRCRHCRIFFLSDPRNAGRTDLGCPFGCRDAHRRESSTRRSVAYYQDDCGKLKKRIQNEKRRKLKVPPSPPELSAIVISENDSTADIFTYVHMLVCLLEGRRISISEVKEMLARGLRQRSIASYRKLEHMIASLKNHPP